MQLPFALLVNKTTHWGSDDLTLLSMIGELDRNSGCIQGRPVAEGWGLLTSGAVAEFGRPVQHVGLPVFSHFHR